MPSIRALTQQAYAALHQLVRVTNSTPRLQAWWDGGPRVGITHLDTHGFGTSTPPCVSAHHALIIAQQAHEVQRAVLALGHALRDHPRTGPLLVHKGMNILMLHTNGHARPKGAITFGALLRPFSHVDCDISTASIAQRLGTFADSPGPSITATLVSSALQGVCGELTGTQKGLDAIAPLFATDHERVWLTHPITQPDAGFHPTNARTYPNVERAKEALFAMPPLMDLHTIIPTIDPTSSVALAIPHHGKSVAITTTLVHKRHKEQVDVVALDGTGPTTALSHTLWPTITRWHALFEACKQVAPILGAGHTSVPITPHVLYVTQGPLGNRHNIAWWNAPITSPFGLLDAWSALRAGDTAWLAKGVGSIVPGKDVTTARALVSSPYASLHPIIV